MVTSATKTLIKTLLAIAVRYGLHQIERKLRGPDANTWLHRIMYFIPNSMLHSMIMGARRRIHWNLGSLCAHVRT
jgi:hypothetical protein